MDQSANCGAIVPKVCNFMNHGKTEKHQERVPVQGRARLNLNLRKFSSNIIIQVPFYDKGIAMPPKVGLSSGL